jgi:methylphosphotriester-DNA--protein-cysteine methyltransferase
MELDQEACYRAISTRDARFDGRIFIAVRTTRIYAFSQTGCEKVAPAGQFETGGRLPVTCPP